MEMRKWMIKSKLTTFFVFLGMVNIEVSDDDVPLSVLQKSPKKINDSPMSNASSKENKPPVVSQSLSIFLYS